jgi:hypothetical protein
VILTVPGIDDLPGRPGATRAREVAQDLIDAPTITLCQQNPPLSCQAVYTPRDLSRSSIWHWGPPSWAAIPYLLCHELVCHVNQGAPMDSGDPFAEGWMDLVAMRLHDEWANEIFPWAPAMARSAASRLSDVVLRRWQGLAEPSMTTRAARVQGRYAAEFVAQLLEPSRNATDRGPGELTCLSLQLNVVPSIVAARKDFVSRVNQARFDPALQARLLAALGRWRQGVHVNKVLFFS